jgi:hypothetical protein
MIRRIGNKPTSSDALRLTLTLKKYEPAKGKGEWMRYGGSKTESWEITGTVTIEEVMAEVRGALERRFKE